MKIVVFKCGSSYGVVQNEDGFPFLNDDEIDELKIELLDEEMRVIDVAALFESEVM